jgi:hypothetical protein
LRYNVHGRDWFGSKRFADLPLRDPNSSVVWAKPRRDGSHIGFYHTVMSNPAPDLTIVSMDVISPLNPANVLLVGAAVTSSDRPLQPSPIPQSPEPFRCVIDFVIKDSANASAEPASAKPGSAALQFTLIGPGLTVEYPGFHADSAGSVAIDVPLGPLSEIRYHAMGANGATAEGTLAKDENGLFAVRHSVILKKANAPSPALIETSK